VPLAPDDEMVVHRDPERLADLHDGLRHVDVGARWRRVAGRMVVEQYSLGRYRIEPKGILAKSRNRWGMGLGPVVCDPTCSSSSTTSSHSEDAVNTLGHQQP
jgi:hypothetical protein